RTHPPLQIRLKWLGKRGVEGEENTLHCFVTGFHPPKIEIELLKNNQPMTGVQYGDLSFNEKWQFQRDFACRVTHSTMPKSQVYRWDPDF
ncbi:PREDICTED: beta-2-microglobulin, partial [Acanthisitta chloris]|uniref:beta-2-microglobulin n=1 Tax=Acanthisitta chloris TaxID=57068 RepID=UPI0004F0F839